MGMCSEIMVCSMENGTYIVLEVCLMRVVRLVAYKDCVAKSSAVK